MDGKIEIASDRIILLDFFHTLIKNDDDHARKEIEVREYDTELIDLIRDNYVIVISACPYSKSFKALRHLKEKTGYEPDEAYWNFGRHPPALKKYWIEEEIIPRFGDDTEKLLSIESNRYSRLTYRQFNIESRPKSDFL